MGKTETGYNAAAGSTFPGQHTRETACWALWVKDDPATRSLQKLLDQSLDDFMFYPEIDWPRFGVLPPNDARLLGAWRDAGGAMFIFLIVNSPTSHEASSSPALLYAVGPSDMIRRIQKTISNLKGQLARVEERKLSATSAQQVLSAEEDAKSVAKLIRLLGLFTAGANAFSVYLRFAGSPTFASTVMGSVYGVLVGLVHSSAVGLLLILILLFVAYTTRYGLLVLRKL